jgi:tetratricopeptide (TPR) repeat protein
MKGILFLLPAVVVLSFQSAMAQTGEGGLTPPPSDLTVETSVMLQATQQELNELNEQIAREEERLDMVEAQLVIYRRQMAMLSSAESAFLLGEELYTSGSIVWARDAFEAVIYNFPESEYYDDALFRLELIAFELQDFGTALDYFQQLREYNPAFGFIDLAIIAAGLSTYSQGYFPDSRDLYEQVSPAGNYGALAEYLTAVAFVEEGDRLLALTTLQGLLGGSSNFGLEPGLEDRVRIAYAQILVEEGSFDSALSEYSRVSPFSAYYDIAMLGKTWTLMRIARYQDAYNLAEKVLEEVPASDLRSEFELAMANCALGAEDLPMAVSMYTELLTEHRETQDYYEMFLSGSSSMTQEEFESERERLDRIRIGLAELKQVAFNQGDFDLVAQIEEEEESIRGMLTEISTMEAMVALPSDMDTESMALQLTRLIQQSRANTEILVMAADEVHQLAENRGATEDLGNLALLDEEIDKIRLALQDLASKFDGGMTRDLDWVQETQYGIAIATFMERELKRDSVDYIGARYRNLIQAALESGDSLTAGRLDQDRSRDIAELNQRIDEGAIVSSGYFEEYLASYPESRFTPDVLVRLAQLYYDIDNLQHSQQQAAAGSEQFIMEDYSRSIQLYRQVITNHPGSEVEDVARYSLGYCLEAMMDFEGAVENYRELLLASPESDLAAECNIRVGNYYFDIIEYDSALVYYQNIMRYPGSSPNLFQHGLYKLGWTLYLTKDFRGSIAVFAYLLRDDQAIADLGINRRGDLRILDEAREYMAYDFLEMGETPSTAVPTAVSFLSAFNDEATTVSVLGQMARISEELTDWNTAIAAYEALLEADPYAVEAPLYQAKIAQAYEEMGDFGLAAVARDQLVNDYGSESSWFTQVGDQTAIEMADSLRGASFESAIQYYLEQTVLSAEDPAAYAAANLALVERVETYLAQYGRSREAYDYRFHLGDAYYHLGQYIEAGDVYLQVALDSSSFLRQEVALNNAFSSYLTAYDEIPGVDSISLRNKLMETVTEYTALYPDGENAAWFFWAAAPKFFNAGEYEPARQLFGSLYADYPNSGYAARAAKFIADSYQFEEMYAEAEEWYGLASQTAARTGEDLGADIDYLAASSSYNDAASLAQSESPEDLLTAARRWEETAHEHPGSEVAPVSLYDAADTYGRAGDLDSAVRLFRELALLYPGYENASTGLLRAAYLLREEEDFMQAAELYLEAYANFPTAPDMVNALSSAASSYEDAGRDDLAIGVYGQIAADRAGSATMVTQAYARIGEYNYGLGNLSIASSNFTNCLSVYDQYRDGSLDWPSMSAYYLGKISSLDYYSLTGVTTDNVEFKTQLFNETVAAYNRTFTYLDDDYVFRAVLDIGELQEDFANTVGFLAAPPGLGAEGEEAFYNTLMEAYNTYIGRAVSTYENGLDLAIANGIRNDVTDEIAANLDALIPGSSDALGYSDAATPPVDSGATLLPSDTTETTAPEVDGGEQYQSSSPETYTGSTPEEEEGGGCFLWPF